MHEPEIAARQDIIAFHRLVEVQLHALEERYERLEKASTSGPSWWVPIALGAFMALIGAYNTLNQKAMDERIATTNARITSNNDALAKDAGDLQRLAQKVEGIADTQNRRTALVSDVDDLKRRVPTIEQLAQQIPYISTQLRDISAKLDRLQMGGQRDRGSWLFDFEEQGGFP